MKKKDLHEQIGEIIGKHSWKEWVQPAHPHNVEAATINATGLNKELTNFVWKLLKTN